MSGQGGPPPGIDTGAAGGGGGRPEGLRGWIDPNFPVENFQGPKDAPIIIYGYTPSFALCVAAIVLFFVAFCIHTFRIVKFRSWYFIPFALACLMEVVGYAFRSLSAKKNPYNVIYFVVQYFFIVTAPVFISASIYVCLSRLIDWARSLGFAGRKWLRPKLILWIFIGADVVATVLQILGAALIGVSQSDKDYEKADKANTILLGGLAFQTAAFFIFLILLTVFTITLIRDRQFGSSLGGKRGFFAGLFIASILVAIRTVFRLAETSQGIYGELTNNEHYFIGLEFVPIVLAAFIIAWYHPGKYLPNQRLFKNGHVENGQSHPMEPIHSDPRHSTNSHGRKGRF